MSRERITPLVAVRVEKLCEECGAELVFGGIVLTSYPPQYPHSCPSGHKGATLDRVYPCIDYREAP